MSTPAAIQGSYADLKVIKTRKVLAISIEIPIEMSEAFVAAFGMPNPSAEIPVALARLDVNAEADERPRRKFDELPIAQQAGMRASEPLFQTFAFEMLKAPAKSDLGAADAIRNFCGVISRADIEKSESATNAWHRLEDKFIAWKRAA